MGRFFEGAHGDSKVGLGAEPPVGSRGRVPGQEGGKAPLKLKAF